MNTDHIMIISFVWISNFRIIFAMPSKLKLMEEIIFSVRLNKTGGSALELFVKGHWLAKTLLNNSALSLYLVIYPFWWSSGWMQGIFLLLRNNFKTGQYVLVLVKVFLILFEIREWYFDKLRLRTSFYFWKIKKC